MATVIDTLIVKLGLDPSSFTKGEKEVAAQVLKTKNAVNSANDGMAAGFASMAKKFLGWASVIIALKKLISAAADLNAETRQLGIDSKNFGLAANQLRNFQNAAEMMGGKAEDVTASVEGLQKAVYDLTVMGQSSAQLEMLTRLGVQFQDATGHARSFHDIVLDTADALERAQKNGTLNRTEAYFAAKQSGFDEGTAQLILSGRKNAEAELARQEARRQVNGEDIASATKVEQLKTGAEQEVKARGIGVETATVGTVSQAIENVGDMAEKASSKLADFAEAIRDHVIRPLEDLRPTRGIRNNNPGNLKFAGQAGAHQGDDGFAVFNSMEEGVAASKHQLQLYADRGINTVQSIIENWAPKKDHNDTVAYAYDVAQRAGVKSTAELTAEQRDRVLQAMFIHESGKGAAGLVAQPRLTVPLAQAMAGAAVPTPSVNRPTGNTTVNVGPVTVVTQATDANGIAKDMDGAVKRKMQAAQAETGQR
jgi:hypothetical protein